MASYKRLILYSKKQGKWEHGEVSYPCPPICPIMKSYTQAMAPHSTTLAWKLPWTEEPGRLQSMGSLRVGHDWATSLSLFTFHFHALEKEMAAHSSVLAWRIPGMGEPVGLPSMGSHRIGHDWSDLAAAAAAYRGKVEGSFDGSILKCLRTESLESNYLSSYSHFTIPLMDGNLDG